MSIISPLVDLTSIDAIESGFRKGSADPWFAEMAGKLADFFIYCDTARYVYPVRWANQEFLTDSERPELLEMLIKRDSEAWTWEVYSTFEPLSVDMSSSIDAFRYFSAWALNNPLALKRFVKLHNCSWLKCGHRSRVPNDYVYDIGFITSLDSFKRTAKILRINPSDLLYVFDVILRYPYYGQLAGEHRFYLSHPIREAQNYDAIQVSPFEPPKIALSFQSAVSSMAARLSFDSYTALLHEARGYVRKHNIHLLNPGQIETEQVRELCFDLQMEPRFKAVAKTLAVVCGVFGIAGTIPAVAVPAAVLGTAITVASSFWKPLLTRKLTGVRWLRWSLKFDLEEQGRGKTP